MGGETALYKLRVHQIRGWGAVLLLINGEGLKIESRDLFTINSWPVTVILSTPCTEKLLVLVIE